MDSWIGATSGVDAVLIHCGEDRTESQGEALNLSIYLYPNLHLWSLAKTKGHEYKRPKGVSSAGLSLRDGVRSSDIQERLKAESPH